MRKGQQEKRYSSKIYLSSWKIARKQQNKNRKQSLDVGVTKVAMLKSFREYVWIINQYPHLDGIGEQFSFIRLFENKNQKAD